MLHEIRLPACQMHLRWIVELQHDLLDAACGDRIDGSGIDVDWLMKKVQLHGCDEKWTRRFAARKDKVRQSERTVLQNLKAIADLPAEVKKRLLADFRADHRYLDRFRQDATCRLAGVTQPGLISADAALALRGLLESFYAPGLYEGYTFVSSTQAVTFNRDIYIEKYLDKNEDVQVCPYCDGDLGSAELDHFFPKSEYPHLSCHPLNLVPSCHTCNSRGSKGEKEPLEIDATDQLENWFHPFLQPAAKSFQIRIVKDGNEARPVLASDDPPTQQRLDNFANLVGLDERWRTALSIRIRRTQKKIWSHFGHDFDPTLEPAVCEKLKEWAEAVEPDIGLIPFALVDRAFLTSAAQRDPFSLDELISYSTRVDPVTTV